MYQQDLTDLHAALYTVKILSKQIKGADEDLLVLVASITDYLKHKAEKKEGQKLFTKSLERNEKDHVCPTCEKKFEWVYSLIRHCTNEHPDKPIPSREDFKERDRILCRLPDKQNNNVQCRKLVEKSRISRHVLEHHECKKPGKKPGKKGKKPDEEPHKFHGFESSDDGKTWTPAWKKMKGRKKMDKGVLTNYEDISDTTEGNVESEEVAAVPEIRDVQEECPREISKGDVQDVQEECPREMSKRDVQEVGLEQPLKPLLNHHIHDKVANKWIESDGLPSPCVKFTVRVDEDACKTFNIQKIKSLPQRKNKYAIRKHIGFIDSGAACCQGDQDFVKRAGKSIQDLPQSTFKLQGAVGSPIEHIGFIPMVITYNKTETRQWVYITKEKGDFLLGYPALLDLGLVPELGLQESKKRKADELS